jgi:DNA-binding transcriptional regulator YdaS (Cro superfamily)
MAAGRVTREKVKPEVWEMVFRHYTRRELQDLLGVTRQAVAQMAERRSMPAVWASKMHRDTNGILDARILCPEVFMGVF